MSELKYRSIKKWKYELLEEIQYPVPIVATAIHEYTHLTDGILSIYPRYAWDGPSGPTFDTKTFMRGSLFHDALCQLIGEGLLDKKYRKYADRLLRQICLEDGMNTIRAWYVYQAVRFYSRLKGM